MIKRPFISNLGIRRRKFNLVNKDEEILITGYAKLPKGITASEMYGGIIAVGLVVNRESGEIIDSDCTLITRVAKDFVNKIVIGRNLNNLEAIEENLQNNYLGSAKKAIISALRICQEKYRQHLEELK